MLEQSMSLSCSHCKSNDVHHAYTTVEKRGIYPAGTNRFFYVCEHCNGMFFIKKMDAYEPPRIEKHSIHHYGMHIVPGFTEEEALDK